MKRHRKYSFAQEGGCITDTALYYTLCSSRRLFPALMLTIQGLEPEMDYTIYLKVTPADDQRYRYINMKWCATGETEVSQSEHLQTYRHPSSPNTGQFWMKRPISFKSIKISHYPKSKNGNVSYVSSAHNKISSCMILTLTSIPIL